MCKGTKTVKCEFDSNREYFVAMPCNRLTARKYPLKEGSEILFVTIFHDSNVEKWLEGFNLF